MNRSKQTWSKTRRCFAPRSQKEEHGNCSNLIGLTARDLDLATEQRETEKETKSRKRNDMRIGRSKESMAPSHLFQELPKSVNDKMTHETRSVTHLSRPHETHDERSKDRDVEKATKWESTARHEYGGLLLIAAFRHDRKKEALGSCSMLQGETVRAQSTEHTLYRNPLASCCSYPSRLRCTHHVRGKVMMAGSG